MDEDSESKWKLYHYPVSKADVFIDHSQQTDMTDDNRKQTNAFQEVSSA